jgi:hypothetical protein
MAYARALLIAFVVITTFPAFGEDLPVRPDPSITAGLAVGAMNLSSRPRHLSQWQADPLKQSLLEFPKDKIINVLATFGDLESLHFATEIHEFMKNNGFQMGSNGPSSVIFPQRVVGIGEHDRADGSVEIQVGVNQ